MQLKIEKLIKIYNQRKVVNEVSLEINKGEIVGLLGPNGAGKTTTFYMIIGIVKPDGGSIYLNNEDIAKYPMYLRARKGISYLPQESSIFRGLSVWENVYSILEFSNLSKKEQKERCNYLLSQFNVLHLKNQKAYSLSGGERRRVEVARALALKPDFLLLDEPFAGIDPIAIADIQKIIKSLKEKNYGILITDHNVRETLKITDRAYIITDGKILVSGKSKEIAKNELARKYYLGNEFDI